ncbi:hypothetical protein ColLi_04723 [Colletotrichum liriopes]|uniref:Heterokaryon incompatibility domain-containing protein n=1 Tax=Colletotrichum liriopes TaxID=708192 RepID=A0AA37GJQ1_9PEZI|nr:hypothetical protein ColLi_04723 [Colletotrichum liriopes]
MSRPADDSLWRSGALNRILRKPFRPTTAAPAENAEPIEVSEPTGAVEPSDIVDVIGKTPMQSVKCEPPFNKLCPTCKELNLSTEKFLPGQFSDSTLPGLLANPIDSIGLQPRDLGYLDEIYLRRDKCSLCWLLFNATHDDEGPSSSPIPKNRLNTARFIGYIALTNEGKRVRCSIEWLLDGRLLGAPEPGKRHPPPTRRLKVFSPEEIFTESYIMLLLPESSPHAGSSFLARQIPYSHADVGLLQRWLGICKTHHGGSCQPLQSPYETFELLENLKFIDLESESIVVSSRSGAQVTEYATLSYVWGGAQSLTLTQSTLPKFCSRGSLRVDRPNLPKTIRDAMILVKSLGIRYLWVDALCIVQDDEDDKMYIIPRMNIVYGNSVLNICAAAGDNSRYGIPGSPGNRRAAWQPRVECAGLELVATKTVEGLIEHTAWNSRAWTFQERMLSRRSIIFVENRVFFQCRQATWSEEVCSEALTLSWTLEMIRSPLKSFEKNPVRLYLECVELFSGRLLAFQRDRLPAFEGMSAILCPPLRASFLYGLPNSYFDFALLWEKKTSGLRVEDSSSRSLYPSWSWSGWHGTSMWRLPMISGTLLNLHEWLEGHTWIIWYKLAPEKTTFLPVWSSKESHPSPNRWHGYSRTSADGEPFGRRLVLDGDDTRPTMPTSSIRKTECLYFWTHTAFFQISRQSRTGPSFTSKLEPGLHRFGLLDTNGDWCGTIVLEDTWFARVGAIVEFAAISDARDFSMEELDTWNYYVPEDREVSEWHLYYAFLIVLDDDRTIAERAGLAKIYRRAFDLASFAPGKAWREITLG